MRCKSSADLSSSPLFKHNKLRTATKAAGLSAAVEEAGGVITLGADEPARALSALRGQMIWIAGQQKVACEAASVASALHTNRLDATATSRAESLSVCVPASELASCCWGPP